MTNVARQISTIHCARVFQQLDQLEGRGRFGYLSDFEFSILRRIYWTRRVVTNRLGHSEFQDIQGRLGLK